MTNREFATKDKVFIKACELAGVKPTSRQASKFRSEGRRPGKAISFPASRGKAIQFLQEAVNATKELPRTPQAAQVGC